VTGQANGVQTFLRTSLGQLWYPKGPVCRARKPTEQMEHLLPEGTPGLWSTGSQGSHIQENLLGVYWGVLPTGNMDTTHTEQEGSTPCGDTDNVHIAQG
jgi:hypothetical protein